MENNIMSFVLDTFSLMAAVGESELMIRKMALQLISARVIQNEDIAAINEIIANRVKHDK